jgi:Dyp-type peroxidase family
MTTQLRECSVFFGEWPATIAFAAVVTPPNIPSFESAGLAQLRNLLTSYIKSSTELKLWPALGSAGFGARARPEQLARLHFNGDTADVIDFTDRILFGIFLGGTFSDVVAALRKLKLLVESVAAEIVVELGSRFGEGRGHGGFIDGHSNLQELSSEHFASCVFVGSEDKRFEHGSYAVIRKYEEDVELWTDLPDIVQEQILGRRKLSGDLLGGERFWRGDRTECVLSTAHVACARPDRCQSEFLWENRIYRRSVNYTEMPTEGSISQGLVFIALNRNPLKQMQRIHNQAMLPADGDRDLLMTAGYVRPLRTYLVYLPRICSFDLV